MKKVLFILMTLVLAIGLVVPAAITLAADGTQTIHVKQATLEQQGDCEYITLWHFVINQIDNESLAPASIHVTWGCGAADVQLEKFTGKVAHYTTTDYAGCVVTDATAEIYDAWDGQFNLSHVFCGEGPELQGIICVQKFYDTDMNGQWGLDEEELFNWQIEIYDDEDNLVTTLYTYDCTRLEPGNYTVAEVIPEGWGNTTPASVEVEVTEGSEETIWFGNIEQGQICVEKFYDADQDGQWGQYEDELIDWEVKIYDEAGALVATLYTPECIWLYPGNYTAVETMQEGWGNTTPTSVGAEVTAGSEQDLVFGNIQLGKICVEKFYDADQDGQWDQYEDELIDWEVKIYDEAGALVDTLSTPECIWLYPGNYTAEETIPEGWGNTTPASVDAEVTAGSEQDVVFGNIQLGKICVKKFYDANGNGTFDVGEVNLCGWEVKIYDVAGTLVETLSTPACSKWLYPGNYTVTETVPAGWLNTTPKSVTIEVSAAMVQGDKKYDVEFGNVCLGAGGGKTLGFWSNKNGQATMNDGGTLAPELALLSSLNLRNAAGGNFDPTTYTGFRTWLLGANASNMAYMLSAQLAAMELNVEAGLVNGNRLVWTGTQFLTVNQLMALANTSLGNNGFTPAGNPQRAYQEYLKNALDKANNNMNFVQGTPCSYICPTPAP